MTEATWTDKPEADNHYWFYRKEFSKQPELVYVLSEPANCLQTTMGRLTIEEGDMFCVPQEPPIPTWWKQDEAA